MRIVQLITRTIIMGAFFGVLTVAPLSAAPNVKPAGDVQCAGCIGSTDLGTNAVTGANIANDTVTGTHVVDESLTAADIADIHISNGPTYNTAIGTGALSSNTTGFHNAASGAFALQQNTTGDSNTANGSGALNSNTTGFSNTASGLNALAVNTTGVFNTASGSIALRFNSIGTHNTANGVSALQQNTTGNGNTASGVSALLRNTTGSFNTAIGYLAGENLTTGSNNIYANNAGVAVESNTIRIGTSGIQTATYIAGISGAGPINGEAVVIDSTSGRLGTVPSSRRFKDEIRDMGEASSHLLQLRPVTFRYTQAYANGARPVDFGLIAEEVAEVYPDLVTHNTDGQIASVQYHKLVPMLLNEFQKQQRLIEVLTARLARLEALQREPGLVTAEAK